MLRFRSQISSPIAATSVETSIEKNLDNYFRLLKPLTLKCHTLPGTALWPFLFPSGSFLHLIFPLFCRTSDSSALLLTMKLRNHKCYFPDFFFFHVSPTRSERWRELQKIWAFLKFLSKTAGSKKAKSSAIVLQNIFLFQRAISFYKNRYFSDQPLKWLRYLIPVLAQDKSLAWPISFIFSFLIVF